jgi:hypothetical protein
MFIFPQYISFQFVFNFLQNLSEEMRTAGELEEEEAQLAASQVGQPIGNSIKKDKTIF